MAQPFLGQISIAAFGFAPKGWALCNGQLLPINQNQALFALLGSMYGGDGRVNFALPDLRGRAACHVGPATVQGQKVGAETVTLSAGQLPAHSHALRASSDLANSNLPSGALPAARPRAGFAMYGSPGIEPKAMDLSVVGPAGGSQPHENMQPFTTLSFIIALQGIFPSRN